MQWIRLFLSCLLFESVAGSLAYAVICYRKRFWGEEDYFFALSVRKMAFLMYITPVTFLYVYLSRIGFRPRAGYYVIYGEFVAGMVPGMYPVFTILGFLWTGGILTILYKYIRKKKVLVKILKKSRKIHHYDYLNIFSEYQAQFPNARLFLYTNPTINSPVSIRKGKKNIILLPDRTYSKKELRIVLEHETNHIVAGDLQWRLVGQVILFIHWFNPIMYRQFRDLVRYQEIVCDLRSSMDNPWFTKKEYAALLALQTSPNLYLPGISAFAEAKKDVIRRIEIMAKEKKFKHMKKRAMAAGCACLLGISLVPSLAFASTAARLQEAWMRMEETSTEEESQEWSDDWSDESIEICGTDDDGVMEVYMSDMDNKTKSSNTFEETVSKNTRQLFVSVQMSAGESILISADCEDKNITYRIGIKNMDTGTLTSISGQGLLIHTFTIKSGGNYAAYVENSSNRSAHIKGFISYQ